MKLFHGSIQKKLYLLILLATLPVFVILLITELANREQTIKAEEQKIFQDLVVFSQLQQRITDSTEALLRTISAIPYISNLDIEKSKVLLSSLLDANPIYTNAILVDLNGDVVAAGRNHEQTVNLNFADRKQFIDAIARNGFVSGEYVIGKQSARAIFPFGISVPGPEGCPVGAIIIGVELSYYNELFEDRDYYKDSFFGLCDYKGTRLFRYPLGESTSIGGPIKEQVFQAARQNVTGSIITETSEGEVFLIAYTPLYVRGEDNPYIYMFLGQNYSAIQKHSNSILFRLALTTLLSLLLALIMARIGGQRIIVRQIEKISLTARKFSRAEKEISTGIDYSDGEIGDLANTFDSMVETIHNRDAEKNQLEQQLNKAQKMDAIGQLAGGIAHDFNNLLSGILGAADLLESQLPEGSEGREYQKLIVSSAMRAADLAGKLLAFSRTSGNVIKKIDIHGLIIETVQILESTIDKRIELTTSLQAGASLIQGDPSLLQSALLNLGINAAQAISSDGIIAIETRDGDGDIIIEVRDNGCGIPEEIIGKIFEPFFTTKEQGKGTGLGLSAVYGTITRMGGTVTVKSEKAGGTVFTITLPLARDCSSDDIVSDRSLIKGQGTILIVDDEKSLRAMAGMALNKMGYKTITAANGLEALKVIRQKKQEIDLVLLDMIMPRMNGKDCFMKIRKINSHIPVLLCTGLIQESDLEEMKSNGLKSVLHKPYQIYELSRAVNKLLKDPDWSEGI